MIDCVHGGKWIDSPKEILPRFYRQRTCALIGGKYYVPEIHCGTCSGEDDGTSHVSKAIRIVTELIQPKEKKPPCSCEGQVLRIEKTSCCGPVRVFMCSKLGREVWGTKCRSCQDYDPIKEENDG